MYIYYIHEVARNLAAFQQERKQTRKNGINSPIGFYSREGVYRYIYLYILIYRVPGEWGSE